MGFKRRAQESLELAHSSRRHVLMQLHEDRLRAVVDEVRAECSQKVADIVAMTDKEIEGVEADVKAKLLLVRSSWKSTNSLTLSPSSQLAVERLLASY